MARSTNLGMPRIGPDRALKRAVEGYWAGSRDSAALAATARRIRADGWHVQAAAGIDLVPSNDFSLYDHVLDMCCLVGAVPDRFGFDGQRVDIDTYFAMARGTDRHGAPVAPLEMTKWFDTNYHHLVPEVGPETTFRLASDKPVTEFREALALGLDTRPVLLGPVTFLRLSAPTACGFSPLTLLPRLLPVYERVLADLAAAGATWIQLDEPCLVTDLDRHERAALRRAYACLAGATPARLLLATYFGALGDNLDVALRLPVAGWHVDLARGAAQTEAILDHAAVTSTGKPRVLSLGVVDGRNVWRTDLGRTLRSLEDARQRLGERLWIAPSCSLHHVPYDLDLEPDLDPEVRTWLAFARQKLDEVTALATALRTSTEAVADAIAASDAAVAARRASRRTTATEVQQRVASITAADATRESPYARRRRMQNAALALPELPTTTIGSFPQTDDIRRARREHDAGRLSDQDYRAFCERAVASTIAEQEAIGLDVLVHGEPERNDMVQYFAEQLAGFVTTRVGWVQSYGTRCVRPPILFGDVSRPAPITVEWTRYAQSLTARPVKGMLTGPVTILQWSFVRDDRTRADTCRQLALALRDEVRDLEAAGVGIIQVDEPALREGLPLRAADRRGYLDWATECFRLATAGVRDETQVHTHMCYSEFGDILDALVALDADVVSIEATRSGMAVLSDLERSQYPAAVGPGVYDIHAPRVPSVAEIADLIERALDSVPRDRLWINPDCGLKTRTWDQVRPALRNMATAARAARLRSST
ncbi:MAG TPA: 5-methyltetrahydropteroyltriglutamate--homocysteine S-methyltransferase [Acidimicrobiales bacterium]|jgi:5-methyltetrahydropteroyltriglutamate--homocysteine methyltransferase|nr:5-methyltetrahydropteroyltriglutamate--homocysteine S-methyltransferase [Acidimicrobiales bacterium]